jgi:hypothetical protein
MPLDLFSPDYFAQKQHERIAKMKPEDFEAWGDARERYIATKIEPLLTRYRQGDHDWFSDWNRRRGEVIHSSDLIFRLQKLNPHIFVQQQINFPDDWGIYTSAYGRVQFLTGFPKGWMTELSYSIVDDRDLPLEEKRGWRTVLIYCLLKGALQWEDVVREFGEPNDCWNEYRWRETTAEFRHGGDQMIQRNIANLLEM